MATISKRAGGWFVQIRRKGYQPQFRTFPIKVEAERWAREREAVIDRGDQPTNHRDLKRTTLGDLITRYVDEVTPSKRSADTETLRLRKLANAPLCTLLLADLSSAAVAAYRDQRAKEVKPGTVAREMSLLHNVIEVARKDWGYGLTANVVAQVRRLPVQDARNRRLEAGELERLLNALKKTRNPLVGPVIMFAIETGMRRGEILDLEWRYVDLEKRTAHIPHTKTGHARTIPLTEAGVAILKKQKASAGKVFPLSAIALRLSWNRLRERAGLSDLRFHDLRHEAISRFAELGLTTVELAAISGHRDMRMLMRYTHLNPIDLAKRLAGRSWERETQALQG
ncbi:site-specific integrase [Sphingomonas phyllosphaerae]|uniref:site-specific integrase n=1 Tax=Sphingomonas phyllosphaerae TaxID=257003 RepID=UPI0009DC392E|nr:site-specific integrase [Sphingomonas phyllosphaerae]